MTQKILSKNVVEVDQYLRNFFVKKICIAKLYATLYKPNNIFCTHINRELGIYLTITINPSIDSMKINLCNRVHKLNLNIFFFKRKKSMK